MSDEQFTYRGSEFYSKPLWERFFFHGDRTRTVPQPEPRRETESFLAVGESCLTQLIFAVIILFFMTMMGAGALLWLIENVIYSYKP